jgi:hypothetical protein
VLVQSKTFPEQAAGAGALHCPSNFPAGNDAQFRRSAVRQFVPISDEAALREAFAFLANAYEVPVLRHPRRAGEPQRFRRLGAHGRKSDRSQAFATYTAAVTQYGAAAFAGIAIEKPVLAFAPDF